MRAAARSSVWVRMLIVISALTAVLTAASAWWRVTFDGARSSVSVTAGSIEIRSVTLTSGVPSQLIGERRSVRVEREEPGWKWWLERESIQFSGTSAFAIGTGTLIASGGVYTRTTVPLWPAVAALMAGTAWLVIVDRRRRQRRARGCCLWCGYELRGLPGGAACPECAAKPSGQILSNQLLSTHASIGLGDRPCGGGADRADGA